MFSCAIHLYIMFKVKFYWFFNAKSKYWSKRSQLHNDVSREQLIQGNGRRLLIYQALTLCDLREALWARKSGRSAIFTAQQNTHLSMYGQDILCGISKGTIYELVLFCMKLLANYLKTNSWWIFFISSSNSLEVVLHCSTITRATE